MPEKTGSFFEMSVEEYERHVLSHTGLEDEVYKQTAKALNLKGASLLLDLWCGTGQELDEIMKHSPWISVTGLDRSPALLAKLLAKPYASRLTLVNCPNLARPFGSAAYEAAVTVMSMHHFTDEDRLAIYRKIFDALRPGGRYVEADRIALSDAEADAMRAQCAPGSGAPWEMPATGEKIGTLLRAAGFSTVETRWQKGDRAIYTAGKESKK